MWMSGISSYSTSKAQPAPSFNPGSGYSLFDPLTKLVTRIIEYVQKLFSSSQPSTTNASTLPPSTLAERIITATTPPPPLLYAPVRHYFYK